MPKLVVRSFAISLDGFSAAPGQSRQAPFGKNGLRLMDWAFATKHFRKMFGPPPDAKDKTNWKGWWGENPPYHAPVFVLTHTSRPPLEMQGGTTFHFVTDGIESALKQAFAAAKGKDVRLGGGAEDLYECVEFTPSKAVVHLKVVRKSK